jgi:hypothetical protein
VTVANWQRAIGALRRLHGSDLAERAGRIAEAAPDADAQFTQEALTQALRSPNVGVGPGNAYSTYHPFSRFETNNWEDIPGGLNSEENITGLRQLLNRGQGFNEVPWMEYEPGGDQLLLRSQEGRHRSAAIGQRPTIVGINPYQFGDQASFDALRDLPVTEGLFGGARRMPAFGQSYRLFNHGGWAGDHG